VKPDDRVPQPDPPGVAATPPARDAPAGPPLARPATRSCAACGEVLTDDAPVCAACRALMSSGGTILRPRRGPLARAVAAVILLFVVLMTLAALVTAICAPAR
jgi:hypothetical protein